jgi:hypothetical protein
LIDHGFLRSEDGGLIRQTTSIPEARTNLCKSIVGNVASDKVVHGAIPAACLSGLHLCTHGISIPIVGGLLAKQAGSAAQTVLKNRENPKQWQSSDCSACFAGFKKIG